MALPLVITFAFVGLAPQAPRLMSLATGLARSVAKWGPAVQRMLGRFCHAGVVSEATDTIVRVENVVVRVFLQGNQIKLVNLTSPNQQVPKVVVDKVAQEIALNGQKAAMFMKAESLPDYGATEMLSVLFRSVPSWLSNAILSGTNFVP